MTRPQVEHCWKISIRVTFSKRRRSWKGQQKMTWRRKSRCSISYDLFVPESLQFFLASICWCHDTISHRWSAWSWHALSRPMRHFDPLLGANENGWWCVQILARERFGGTCHCYGSRSHWRTGRPRFEPLLPTPHPNCKIKKESQDYWSVIEVIKKSILLGWFFENLFGSGHSISLPEHPVQNQ